MASVYDQVSALGAALINNLELRQELIDQAKSASAKHGLVVYLCHNSMQPLVDSIIVTKSYSPVPGFVFCGVPLRFVTGRAKEIRKQLVDLQKGKIPILLTGTGSETHGLLTISQSATAVLRQLSEKSPGFNPAVVLVDWRVAIDTDYQDSILLDPYKFCSTCGRNFILQLCSKCHAVYYCSRECQVAEWNVHKTECAAFARLTSPASKWFE